MLRRGGQVACRGLLAALQQPQQQCMQLEVCLGYQAVRHKSRDWKVSFTRADREQHRRERIIEKLLAAAEPNAGAGTVATSSVFQAAVPAAASSSDSGPVVSPLSAQVPQQAGAGAASSSSSSSSSSIAPVAVQQQQQSDKPASWRPEWLMRLMDGPRRRSTPPPPPGSSSPLQQAAPAAGDSAAKAGDDDGWADLPRLKEMSMDDYLNMIKAEPQAESIDAPPRPLTPLRGLVAWKKGWVDRARVIHLRYEQQSTLITLMDPEDKLRVKQDPRAALQQPEFIRAVAAKTHMPRDTVRDTISCYNQRREFIVALAEQREEGGEMPPVSDTVAQQELWEARKAAAKQAKEKDLLAARDPRTCKLRTWAGLTSRNATCSRTKLPYELCCGALKGAQRAAARGGGGSGGRRRQQRA